MGWLGLPGGGCSLQHPSSASGKLKSPASASSGMAALATGAQCPPAQWQRVLHELLLLGSHWLVSALSAPEQLLPLPSPHSVDVVCASTRYLPSKWALISTSAQLDQQDMEESCVATHLLVLPSEQGRGARGVPVAVPTHPGGQRRGGGVLYLQPNASRHCPSRLAAPEKRRF